MDNLKAKKVKEADKFSDSLVFEGMTSISAIINSPTINDRKIEKIFYDESKEKNLYDKLKFLRHRADELNYEMIPLSSGEIDSMTIGSSHGGIVAKCTARTFPKLNIDTLNDDGFFVMLEGIEDPYNFGYALRSLYAAGVDGIIVSQRNWMSASGVVCRASAGASEYLPVYVDEDMNSVAMWKKSGDRVI